MLFISVVIGRLTTWIVAGYSMFGVVAFFVGFAVIDWLVRRVSVVKLQDREPLRFIVQQQQENINLLGINTVKAHKRMLTPRKIQSAILILAGVFLLAIAYGIYLYKAYLNGFNQSQPKVATLTTNPTPQTYTPVKVPTPVSTPKPTPQATPKPSSTPAPEPIPPSSVKQIGENTWRVIVSGNNWYDTGIPVVSNMTVGVEPSSNYVKYLVKLGQKTFFSTDEHFSNSYYVYVSETLGDKRGIDADYAFRDTLKLRLDNESKEKWLSATVSVSRTDDYLANDIARRNRAGWYSRDFKDNPAYQDHMARHQPALDWWQMKYDAIARR